MGSKTAEWCTLSWMFTLSSLACSVAINYLLSKFWAIEVELDVHSELSRLLRRAISRWWWSGQMLKHKPTWLLAHGHVHDQQQCLSHVPIQGHSHQIWSGEVSGACISMQQLGGSGGIPPRKFGEFRGYEIASETIFGPKWCFSEARQQSLTCMNIYPFLPVVPCSTGFGFPIVC